MKVVVEGESVPPRAASSRAAEDAPGAGAGLSPARPVPTLPASSRAAEDAPGDQRRRAALNVILPGRILQRGQIYTWTRDYKITIFRESGITAIINFWPKMDQELCDIGLDWYWQVSCPKSEQMMEKRITCAADSVADYLRRVENSTVLVLCEAGKTRSVFFCVLLLRRLLRVNYSEATRMATKAVSGSSLKGFMLNWLKEQER